MSKECAWPSSRPPSRAGRCATPPSARGAARGPTTPEPTPLPLSTSQTSLPACTRYLFTGAVSDLGRRGGRRGVRGGLSPPPLRVDPGAAMLRATRPGGGRRINPSSCPGAQAGCPLRGRAQASHAAAGQPQGSSGGHSGGGLRGGPKPRTTMVITIVLHEATVSRGVKRND